MIYSTTPVFKKESHKDVRIASLSLRLHHHAGELLHSFAGLLEVPGDMNTVGTGMMTVTSRTDACCKVEDTLASGRAAVAGCPSWRELTNQDWPSTPVNS